MLYLYVYVHIHRSVYPNIHIYLNKHPLTHYAQFLTNTLFIQCITTTRAQTASNPAMRVCVCVCVSPCDSNMDILSLH